MTESTPPSPPSPLPRWLFALLLFAPAVLVLLGPRLAPLLRDPLVGDIAVKITGAEALAQPGGALRLEGAWREGSERGARLDDGATTAALSLTFPPGPWDELTLRVVGHPQATWRLSTTRLFGPGDDPMQQTIERRSAAAPLINEEERVVAFDAGRLAALGAGSVNVRLELIGPPPSQSDHALVRFVEARVASRVLNPMPHVPDYVALAVLPLLLAMALWVGMAWSPTRVGMAALGLGVLGAMVLRMGGLRGPEQGAIMAVAMAAALFVVTRGLVATWGWRPLRPGKDGSIAPAAALALLAAVIAVGLLAVEMRWGPLEIARRLPLSPDGREFVDLARRGGSLYNTTFAEWPFIREPLMVWLLRGWQAVAPATDASARLASVLIAVVAMMVAAVAGTRLFGPAVGIAAAAILAANPAWSEESARVLRLDLGLMLLALLMMTRANDKGPGWQRAVAWGVVGGALMLMRLGAVTLVAPALAWEIARRRVAPRDGALAVGIMAALVAPFLYASTFGGAGGDPLLAINTHAQYYTGAPGSFTDIALSGSWIDIAGRHVAGAWDRFVWGPPRVRLFHGHEWAMLPGLVGAWALWRRRQAWVAAWALLWAVPYLAVAGTGASWRLGAEVHLVVLWVWALGVETMAMWLIAAARGRTKQTTAEPA